jgi:hypothetical protein
MHGTVSLLCQANALDSIISARTKSNFYAFVAAWSIVVAEVADLDETGSIERAVTICSWLF